MKIRKSVALAGSAAGGFLYGNFTVSTKGVIAGKITGGSGSYKGDTGTISGQAASTGPTITVTYS